MEQYPINNPKKKSRAPIVIAVVVLAALIGGGIFAGVKLFKKNVEPVMSVVAAVENSLDAAEKAEVYELSHAVLNGGSMEISGSAAELTKTLVGASIDASLNATAYFDAENNQTAVQASASLSGTELADLLVYADKTTLSAESEVLFGSRALGTDLTKFREHYRSSAFSTGGAYDLGLDTAQVCDLVEGFTAHQGNHEERKKLALKVLVNLGEIVRENAEITEEEGQLTVAGNAIDTTDVHVAIDGHQFVAIIRESCDYLKTTDDLKETWDALARGLAQADPELGTKEQLFAKMDEFVAEAEKAEANGELDDFRAVLVFHISPETQLIGADVNVNSESHDTSWEMRAVCGPDWSKPAEIRFGARVDVPSGLLGEAESEEISESFSFVVTYAVSEDSDARYASVYNITYNDEEIVHGAVTWNRVEGDFEASISADGQRFAVYGTLFKTEEGAELTVDSVTFANEVYQLGGVKFIFRTSAEMPAHRETFDDVLTMPESEIDTLAADIDDFVGDVSGEITRILLFSAISGFFGGGN